MTRKRLAHGTRPDFHAGQIGDKQRCFRLPVAIVDHEPKVFAPHRDHFGIERLASAGTVPQVRKVVTAEVFLHEQTIFRRWGTKHTDFVVLQQGQFPFRVEAPAILEHRRTGAPRAEQHTVCGFCPTRVGGGPVEVARGEVEPIEAGVPVCPSVRVGV
ncbi:hypothetical protein HRbin30_03164 [bacterium HR30]|nr:hypothetical protein HRbin30_03164 [bacterium HR30]